MQRAEGNTDIDPEQTRMADSGMKGMIPIGRPFFDYIISALADAGITDVCLVIGPEHQSVRDYFEHAVALTRVRIHFAIQERPLGTADAVLAAESFAAGEPIVVVNSDNYYPVHTLRALCELGMGGVAAFERAALVRLGNIDAERIAKYSVVDFDERGLLKRIVEKPGPEMVATLRGEVFVGMNSWSLPPEIYQACRSIQRSARGELELPAAVQYARDQLNVPFRVLTFHDGVLDLSFRSDIAAVALFLAGIEPRL
jgi:glucose-1-phosphate thymidylyltransferase